MQAGNLAADADGPDADGADEDGMVVTLRVVPVKSTRRPSSHKPVTESLRQQPARLDAAHPVNHHRHRTDSRAASSGSAGTRITTR